MARARHGEGTSHFGIPPRSLPKIVLDLPPGAHRENNGHRLGLAQSVKVSSKERSLVCGIWMRTLGKKTSNLAHALLHLTCFLQSLPHTLPDAMNQLHQELSFGDAPLRWPQERVASSRAGDLLVFGLAIERGMVWLGVFGGGHHTFVAVVVLKFNLVLLLAPRFRSSAGGRWQINNPAPWNLCDAALSSRRNPFSCPLNLIQPYLGELLVCVLPGQGRDSKTPEIVRGTLGYILGRQFGGIHKVLLHSCGVFAPGYPSAELVFESTARKTCYRRISWGKCLHQTRSVHRADPVTTSRTRAGMGEG